MDRDAIVNAKTGDNRFYFSITTANMYDFSFLAPCPSSGMIINGGADRIAPTSATVELVDKLREQKGITVTHNEMEGAGHFFEEPYMDRMLDTVTTYVKKRLTETTR